MALPKRNTFLSGLTNNDVVGENNMPAHSTSESAVLDLFFLLGTRPRDFAPLLARAWGEDANLTAKVLFQSRDVREGKGERDSFRYAMHILAKEGAPLGHLIPLIPEYGRWDDLFAFFETPLEGAALAAIDMGLSTGNGLCAKWMPRQGKVAGRIRDYLEITPKSYRKLLVGLTKVVETPMCAQEWGAINYSHVPSRAGKIYSRAFLRHDKDRYEAWKAELRKAPEEREQGVKINVGVLYPHEVMNQARANGTYPFEEAWAKMQELFPTTEERIIPVCDVSGSMLGLPLEVSVSLGLFLSQRNKGPFADCFITFSGRPQLQRLTGTLRERLRQLETSQWEMNTNLEAVFNLIERAAHGANPEDIPSIILILSDMQFDQCVTRPGANAFEMYKARFDRLGVMMPKVVFWNLREEGGKTLPVKMHQSGAALVSGFSPNMLKALLGNPKEFTPLGIMLTALMTPRYEKVVIG